MNDTASRQNARRILGGMTKSAWRSLAMTAICMNLALAVAFWPEYEQLSRDAETALFILVFCACLWLSEAMPAFAVSLLAIGLEIALLGRPAAEGNGHEWEKFIATWGSPLIWLFFGGFVLAAAAEKTGLDRWMARRTLVYFGSRPALVLLGVMSLTAVLSMFISNTATATLMTTVLSPLIVRGNGAAPMAKPLLLGIAFGANVGGMGTVIGTPPNAIAAGTIETVAAVNFAKWMTFGVPPAALLLTLAWAYLILTYLGKAAFVPGEKISFDAKDSPLPVPLLQQSVVVGVFAATVLMWLTSPLHGVPTAAVSFIPICVLTATGTLGSDDVKGIPWDVLILIAGGLSLGVAINDTGLASWLVAKLPLDNVSPPVVSIALCYMAVLLSNLMSNTAAANLILPLALTMLGVENAAFVVPIALSASAAMCLPISTPPNAIVYGTGQIHSGDLLRAGLVVGLVGPPVVVGWTILVQTW